MSTFFYADGRVEEHRTDPRLPTWKIADEPEPLSLFVAMDMQPRDFVLIKVTTFKQHQPDTYTEIAPGNFAALVSMVTWHIAVQYRDQYLMPEFVSQGALAVEDAARRMHRPGWHNTPAGRAWLSRLNVRHLPEGPDGMSEIRISQVHIMWPLPSCEATAAPEVLTDVP